MKIFQNEVNNSSEKQKLHLSFIDSTTEEHRKSIYFLHYYHIIVVCWRKTEIPLCYKAIRHISIIKAKIRIFFVITSIFIEKYFSALVMSFYRESATHIIVVGVDSSRESHRSRLYTSKVTVSCGGGCFIHIYWLFFIFSRRPIIILGEHTSWHADRKKKPIFQLIPNWIFPLIY